MSDDIITPVADAADERFEDLVGEDLVISRVEADNLALSTSAIGSATVGDAQLTGSAAGAVLASQSASLSMAGAGVVAAQGDISLERSGSGTILAGGNVSITQGGAETIVSAGSVSMDGGGAGIVAAREIAIKDGWVGMAVGSTVELAEGVEVMFGPREAMWFGAAFGAIFGLVFGLVSLMRRGYDEE